MPEVRRSPEQRLNELFDKLARQALEWRKTLSSDEASVGRAMQGSIADTDPKRNEYFGEIISRLRKLRKRQPAAGVERRREPVVQKIVTARQVPENAPTQEKWQKMIEDAKEKLRQQAVAKARAEAIEQARELEQSYPEDTYKVEEETL